jgi:hypothetical protein
MSSSSSEVRSDCIPSPEENDRPWDMQSRAHDPASFAASQYKEALPIFA